MSVLAVWAGVATARVSEDPKEQSVIDAATTCASCGEVEGYIMTLGVADKYRGRRLGSRLLKAIMGRMLGDIKCDYLTLHMKEGNAAALRLYESHDFQVVEDLPLHYLINEQKYNAVRLLYRVPQPLLMRWCGPLVPCVSVVNGVTIRILERLFGKAIPGSM